MNCKFISYDNKVSYDLEFNDDNISICDKEKKYCGKLKNCKGSEYSYINFFISNPDVLNEVTKERIKSGYDLGNILKIYNVNEALIIFRDNDVIEIIYTNFCVFVSYVIGKKFIL